MRTGELETRSTKSETNGNDPKRQIPNEPYEAIWPDVAWGFFALSIADEESKRDKATVVRASAFGICFFEHCRLFRISIFGFRAFSLLVGLV